MVNHFRNKKKKKKSHSAVKPRGTCKDKSNKTVGYHILITTS